MLFKLFNCKGNKYDEQGVVEFASVLKYVAIETFSKVN